MGMGLPAPNLKNQMKKIIRRIKNKFKKQRQPSLLAVSVINFNTIPFITRFIQNGQLDTILKNK